MHPIEVPEFPKLRGEKAIKAIYNFLNELEEQRGKELTDKQTTVLIKLAKGLISSIEAERRAGTSDKDVKEGCFVTRLKRTIMKYISESFRAHGNERLWKSIR